MNKPLRPTQRGQSLVEFAMILPIFLLLAVVIFDLGRGVYYYSAIHNAAREGARYGVVYPNDSATMKSKAANYAIGLGTTPADVTAGYLRNDLNGNEAYIVKVTVNYCFVPVTPLVDLFIPKQDPAAKCQDLPMSSEAVMRTEAKPSP
jgi:Flp pilus assembly protein TadG